MALQITDAHNNYGPLQTGDVLFKNTETAFEIGKIIQAGQLVSAAVKFWGVSRVKDAKWEHAAIAANDTGTIYEAVSKGVTVNEMASGADYIVFRCQNNEVSIAATNFAKMLFEQKLEASDAGENRFNYSIKKAVKSWANPSKKAPTLDSIDNRINTLFPPANSPAQAQNMFCSQFVALCYSIGAGQIGEDPAHYISKKDHLLTPSEMVSLLRNNNNWRLIGISARGRTRA